MSLRARVDEFDCVSFDVFDTAILRRVARPEQALAIAGRQYCFRAGARGFDFAAARREAETLARARGGGGDPTLDAIYQALELPPDWAPEILRALELETELRLCARNEFIHGVYTHAIESGKTVVFASDMYLPESTVAQILDGAGYRGYRKLYLSSALQGDAKWSGALYRHILRDLNIAPGRLLHIGDDPWSDVLAAAREGVVPAPYARPRAPARAAAGEAEWLRAGLAGLRRAAGRDGSLAARLGYEELGLYCVARAAGQGVDGAARAFAALGLRSPRLASGAREFAADFLPLCAEYPWLALPAPADIAFHRRLYYWLVDP